jgi:hypothetical protein
MGRHTRELRHWRMLRTLRLDCLRIGVTYLAVLERG